MIEHLKDIESAEALVGNIRKILNAKGRLVIATPDYIRWKADFVNCDYTHDLPFTIRRLRQLLMNSGFRITYSTIYVGPVFGKHGLPLSWLARLTYVRLLDDLLGNSLRSDVWYRGYLTFLPNLIVIAEKE
jgi:hypothetical protein